MKNNLKENTKLRCKDSPRKEDIGKIFEYENIIDKEKGHKKMKQNKDAAKKKSKLDLILEQIHNLDVNLNARIDNLERRFDILEKRFDNLENKVETVIKLNNLKTE
ncbi:MAG: hypothetical protein Ta2E_07890 [Mycoplasmoidaceae bacterium]|nr:MAG: hypothetical protein Ta2E_07890 [Mycoplasmoidaceae bacterium]